LSSGQQPTAALGIDLLQDLQKVAGTSLEVMPGGGINDNNVPLFLDAGFKSIHLSAKSATHSAHLEPIINPHILKNVITLSSK
jgi:copper homeostasis protein